MTSSFVNIVRLVVIGAAAGCGGSTVERALRLERVVEPPCAATVDGEARGVNLFVAEVFRLDGIADGVTLSDAICEQCIDGDGRAPCQVQQRRCRCTDALPMEPEQLAAELRSLDFDPLIAGTYCFRVLLLELPEVSSATVACPCEPGDMVANGARGCAVSPPVDVTASPDQDPVVLPLVCRDDPLRARQRCTHQ